MQGHSGHGITSVERVYLAPTIPLHHAVNTGFKRLSAEVVLAASFRSGLTGIKWLKDTAEMIGGDGGIEWPFWGVSGVFGLIPVPEHWSGLRYRNAARGEGKSIIEMPWVKSLLQVWFRRSNM